MGNTIQILSNIQFMKAAVHLYFRLSKGVVTLKRCFMVIPTPTTQCTKKKKRLSLGLNGLPSTKESKDRNQNMWVKLNTDLLNYTLSSLLSSVKLQFLLHPTHSQWSEHITAPHIECKLILFLQY